MVIKISGSQFVGLLRLEHFNNKVLTKKFQNEDHLMTALRWERAKILQSHFRAACDDFVDHLKAIIRTKGGQFDFMLFPYFFAFEHYISTTLLS